MNERSVAKVDAILKNFVAGQQAAADAREAAKLRVASFRREFLRLQNSIVVPAMHAIGDLVRSRGYEFEVEAAREASDLRAAEPRTRLLVAITRGGGRQHRPSLDAICDTRGEAIRFEVHIPTRGSFVTKLAEVSPSDLGEDFVHARAVEFLQQIFDEKPL